MSVVTPLIIQRMGEARAKLAACDQPLTIAEATAVLGVCPATLYAWRNKGLIAWQASPANRHSPPARCVRPEDLRRLLGIAPMTPSPKQGERL